jgi:hypothetical protein
MLLGLQASVIMSRHGWLPRFLIVVFRFGLIIGLRPFLVIRLQFRLERYAGSRHVSPAPFGMGFSSLRRIGESWRVPFVMLWLRMARLVRAMSRWSFRYCEDHVSMWYIM